MRELQAMVQVAEELRAAAKSSLPPKACIGCTAPWDGVAGMVNTPAGWRHLVCPVSPADSSA